MSEIRGNTPAISHPWGPIADEICPLRAISPQFVVTREYLGGLFSVSLKVLSSSLDGGWYKTACATGIEVA